jgi:hypothetical protein
VFFSVYFLFIFSIILHQMFLPSLKLQYSLFILAGYHGSKVVEYVRNLFNKKLMNKLPWQRSHLQMRIFENLLYVVSYLSLMIFLYFDASNQLNGFAAIVPAGLACAISCLCIGYEETPCNATMNLLTKVISVLRILIAVSAFMKVDKQTNWEWSTTFWPYWCSFAI